MKALANLATARALVASVPRLRPAACGRWPRSRGGFAETGRGRCSPSGGLRPWSNLRLGRDVRRDAVVLRRRCSVGRGTRRPWMGWMRRARKARTIRGVQIASVGSIGCSATTYVIVWEAFGPGTPLRVPMNGPLGWSRLRGEATRPSPPGTRPKRISGGSDPGEGAIDRRRSGCELRTGAEVTGVRGGLRRAKLTARAVGTTEDEQDPSSVRVARLARAWAKETSAAIDEDKRASMTGPTPRRRDGHDRVGIDGTLRMEWVVGPVIGRGSRPTSTPNSQRDRGQQRILQETIPMGSGTPADLPDNAASWAPSGWAVRCWGVEPGWRGLSSTLLRREGQPSGCRSRSAHDSSWKVCTVPPRSCVRRCWGS